MWIQKCVLEAHGGKWVGVADFDATRYQCGASDTELAVAMAVDRNAPQKSILSTAIAIASSMSLAPHWYLVPSMSAKPTHLPSRR